jgi:hypothetical protein
MAAMASASAKMPRRLCILGFMTDLKFSDAECANTTNVGATRSCMAFLGRRVRNSHARNVIAQQIRRLLEWRVTELYGRNGVGVSKIVYSVYSGSSVTERKFRDADVRCQPGGLARRFGSNASARDMPATPLSNHSPPNNMASHRTS